VPEHLLYDPNAKLNQYGRRGKAALELPAGYCPDPAVDLPGARVWVMHHHFGVELYSWQKREMHVLGAFPRPRLAYVQLGRKNGKTMFAAALLLTELALVADTAGYAVPDSEGTLQSALVGDMKRLIARSPTASTAYVVTNAKIEYPHNGSFFEVRPNKFAATQSINPTIVVIDEVHLQKSGEMWDGFDLADPGGGNFLLLGITTPGYDLSSFANDLYQRVKNGDPTLYGRIFEPDDLECDLDDEAAWAQANPRLEDDPAFMDVIRGQRASGMPEHEFRRFRLGIWTATASAWLPYGAWDACSTGRVLTPDDLGPNDQAWLGFDGSFSGDSTALVVAVGNHVSVAGCWENPGRKGWRVPRDQVEATIARWMDASRGVRLLADPPYWRTELSAWSLRWPRRVIEFPTHVRARMAPACTTLYAGVMEGTLTHDGDRRLARHVANAIVKTSPEGDYITKPDPKSPAKIDLAVAAVVAYSASSAAVRDRGPVVASAGR
jgi:phage terminase large subunit-like protein